jgi:hypothetical protein
VSRVPRGIVPVDWGPARIKPSPMRVSCDVSPNALAQSHMDPRSCGIVPTYWRSRAPAASGARRLLARQPSANLRASPAAYWPNVGRLLPSGEQAATFDAHVPRFASLFVATVAPWATKHSRAARKGIGAGDGIRTRDILLGRQVLHQLSYSRSIAPSRRLTVRARWQFAHTISHLATSTKIRASPARPIIAGTLERFVLGSR